MNIDILQDNQNSANYLNLLENSGFINCIKSPTREHFKSNRLSRTCIDHCFVKSMIIDSSYVVHSKISDHYPIDIKLKTKIRGKLKDNSRIIKYTMRRR